MSSGVDAPAIAPEFRVHDVTWVRDAAAPTLSFALGVTETSGREVFTIALTAQINIDPARRQYDAETRAELVELFGAPERWASTTKSFVWAHVTTLVPSFTAETTFTLPVACTYDLELAAAKYLYTLPDGDVPLSFHFTGSVLHRGDAGQLQVVLIPWTCSADWRMPVGIWREMMDHHYPNGAWVRLHPQTMSALSRYRAREGLPSYDACVADLLGMADVLEELLHTLLYEGYALYPYTPGATKNATPTPFGIVYPPVYAQATPGSFDKLRMQGIVHAGGDAVLRGEVRYLLGSGERHQAVEGRLDAPGQPLADLARTPHVEPFERDGLLGRVRMSADDLGEGRWRVMLCVHNTTPVDEGLDRAGALAASLISTHPLLRLEGGRFESPLEAAGAESVNTYPVLATDADDTLLGAAIVLPDHPQLAPESRGDLFDGTEIEEALLLHVLALSDEERAAIAEQDPAVREMLARAEATTPEDIVALHGRTVLSEPQEPPGEKQVEVDGVTFRLGDKVVLRLADRPDPYDQMLNGRVATLERIYYDYDNKLYFAVTVDDDPAQELMRETGRFLFFFTGELEARWT